MSDLTFQPLAESGLLVELPDVIDRDIVARVMALSAALDRTALPGLLDVVPSYRTLLLAFDPALTDGERLIAVVRRLDQEASGQDVPAGRDVTIPVCYGGALGPDLPDVATHTGLAPGEVCARHAAASYQVACMGFAPGFGFLIGLPPVLATPRRATPRTKVPAGSVAIGGAQTGVYPSDLPGGWNLIGRTPLRLVDFAQPAPFRLAPGDTVRFAPISEAEYTAMIGADGDD